MAIPCPRPLRRVSSWGKLAAIAALCYVVLRASRTLPHEPPSTKAPAEPGLPAVASRPREAIEVPDNVRDDATRDLQPPADEQAEVAGQVVVASSAADSRLTLHLVCSVEALTAHGFWESVRQGDTEELLHDRLPLDIRLYVAEETEEHAAQRLIQALPWSHGSASVARLETLAKGIVDAARRPRHPTLGERDWIGVFKNPVAGSKYFADGFRVMQRKFFVQPGKALDALAGFSLMIDTFYEDTLGYRPAYPYSRETDTYTVFGLQQPQANAGFYPARVLAAVLDWLPTRGRDLLPEPGDLRSTEAGPFFAAFGRGMHHFLIEHGMVMLYPAEKTVNLVSLTPSPARRAVSPGDMDGFASAVAQVTIADYLSLPVYDGGGVYQKRYSVGKLWPEDTSSTGKCTLILTIYSRHESFITRLRYYNSVRCLKEILVIWNNVDSPPPPLKREDFHIPVTVDVRDRNSLNNRFLPHDTISTDCVIIMDDDWNMPRHVLNFATRVWEAYPDSVVGLQKQGRMHAVAADGSYTYKKNMNQPISIVLPPWVFHRKYLDTFTNELPQATRDEVDQMTNCDDLLFNFMMAAQSRRAPVVLDTRGIKRMHHLRKFARGEGLSKRDSHYTQRDQCLNDFAKAFGQMPLRYARTAVPIHSAPGQPVPAASAIDSADMHCVLCDSHEGLGDGEDCVRCEIK